MFFSIMNIDDLCIPPQQLPAYEQLYHEMNAANEAFVPASVAAAFLRRSGLPVPVLGQIWELADYCKQGALDKRGAFIALKLVAAVQQGHVVHMASLSLGGLNLPVLGSRTTTPAPSSLGNASAQASPSRNAANFPHSPSGGVDASTTWGISSVDQAKYDSIFESLAPENGKLSGVKVRPVLLNSGLPPAVLARIWELADQDKDGELDRVEMSVALHLVYKALQNEAVPNVLPASLVHPSKLALSRRTSAASHLSGQDFGVNALANRMRTASLASLEGASLSSGPVGQADPQRSFSVQPSAYARHGSVSSTPVPASMSGGALDWPVDMTEALPVFHRCDTDHDGFVRGPDVMAEFLRSGLPQQTLAHIWSLADVHSTGSLNSEQFALAMHLVTVARSGQTLPQSLPPNLVPPSLRELQLPRTAPQTPSAPAPPLPTSASQHIALAAQSDNPELKQLATDMERLIQERREADEKVTQLEADMTVKNSEIRNLQIELTTLESTVKQLDRQKIEAGKRLAELDSQIETLEEQCRVQEEKVDEAQARLDNLKAETELGAANAEKNAATLSTLQNEARELEAQKKSLDAALVSENAAMERSVNELTSLERESERIARMHEQMAAEKAKILEVTEALKAALELPDANEKLASLPALYATFKSPEMVCLVRQRARLQFSEASTSAAMPPRPVAPALAAGGQSDPFAGRDPFAASPGGSAAFGAGFAADPFTASTAAPGRPAPPRPAPPRASPAPAAPSFASDPFAGQDPFGAPTASAGGSGFADFSNFAAFG